jgi:hypothetical protein
VFGAFTLCIIDIFHCGLVFGVLTLVGDTSPCGGFTQFGTLAGASHMVCELLRKLGFECSFKRRSMIAERQIIVSER